MPPRIATALLLSPDQRHLYVTLSNRDAVAVVSTADGTVERYLSTSLPGQTYGGSYPNALAQSPDGSKLYVADASADAIAVFDVQDYSKVSKAGGVSYASGLSGLNGQPVDAQTAAYFIPTEWYPTAVAVQGGELLIASGKGEGTGPNAEWTADPDHPGKLRHPYIAHHASRLDHAGVLGRGGEKPGQVYRRKLFAATRWKAVPAKISFQRRRRTQSVM